MSDYLTSSDVKDELPLFVIDFSGGFHTLMIFALKQLFS